MNTLFSLAPFRRFDLGSHARLSLGGSPRLGQDFIEQISTAIGLPNEVEDFIRNLPEAEKNFNRERWKECQEIKDDIKRAACSLRVLNDLRAGKTKPEQVTPLPSAAPSTFPILPVAIGLAAAGGLVWYLASRGK